MIPTGTVAAIPHPPLAMPVPAPIFAPRAAPPQDSDACAHRLAIHPTRPSANFGAEQIQSEGAVKIFSLFSIQAKQAPISFNVHAKTKDSAVSRMSASGRATRNHGNSTYNVASPMGFHVVGNS